MNINDTIVALSTAPGAAAIAIVRLSGDTSIEIAEKCFRSRFGKKTFRASHTQRTFGRFLSSKYTTR